MGLWDNRTAGTLALPRISSQPPPPQDLLMVEAPRPILGGTEQTHGHRVARPGKLRKRLPRAAARPIVRAASSGTHNPLSIQWLLRNSGVTTDAGRTGALLVVASLEEHRARTLTTTTVCELR